ncbi:hypothetical protein LPJ70_005329, partial [Coemansia sp. RSA 2708]
PVGEHIRDVRDRLAATALVHTACRRNVLRRDRPQFNGILEGPTDGFDFSCPSCSIDSLPNEDVTPVFAIRARIDDGTASLVVQVTPAAAADILRVSPSQLLELPDRREQQGVLTRPRGREVVVSITTFSEPLSIEREVRIDAVCESGDVGMPSASI